MLLLAALAIGAAAYYYYDYATIASAEVAIVHRGTALASVYGTVNVAPRPSGHREKHEISAR